MKFCRYCGAEIDEKAVICVHCGRSLEQEFTAPDDSSSTGMAILGFCFPIVGFVMYAVDSKVKPKRAKSSLKGAIAGIISSFVFSFIFYIIYFVFIFQLGGMY